MVYMLLEGGLDPPPVFGPDSYVNLECATYKRRLPPPGKRRAFFTHLLFKDLPTAVEDKKVRIVHIARNPKDVMVSLYCLQEKMPPPQYHPTWPQFFATMLDDGHWSGNIFNHVTNWEQTIDGHPDHPIYSLTYEELTQDTVGHLEKLDQFLETHRGRQLCQDVADKCNVGNMTELRMAQDSVLNRDMLYRKGVIGDWKNWFTVAQNDCHVLDDRDTVGHLEKLDQFLETHRGRQFCQDVADKCNIGNMTELRMAQDSVLIRDMLYRKGVLGDWKNWFTVAQNEEYKEVYRLKMAGSKWFRVYDQD